MGKLQVMKARAISEIVATLIEIKKKGLEIDKNKFIGEIMGRYGVGTITAKDYLTTAQYRTEEIQSELQQVESQT